MQEKYAVIFPLDLQNPFQNPTEEPEYSPDYRELLPEQDDDKPCRMLPLIPTTAERNNIRKMFSLTFLSMLFAFFTTATVHTALTLGLPLLLRIIDMQREGSLPQNYTQIVSQYFTDSSISSAITLLSFFIGNLSGFWVGCRLTRLSLRDFFKTRRLTAPRMILYFVIGLWIQLLASEAGDHLVRLVPWIAKAFPETTTLRVDGSGMRLAVTLVYACLIAPVTEELLFRGMLLKNASRVGQRFGIFLSAFLFALLHGTPTQFLFTFPFGILLGYITIRHNSLTPAIFVHIIVNGMAMLSVVGKSMLTASTFRTVHMIYMLSVIAIGSVAFLYLALTERLPDRTPHQGFRCLRIAVTSPLFWALICAQLVSLLYPLV